MDNRIIVFTHLVTPVSRARKENSGFQGLTTEWLFLPKDGLHAPPVSGAGTGGATLERKRKMEDLVTRIIHSVEIDTKEQHFIRFNTDIGPICYATEGE